MKQGILRLCAEYPGLSIDAMLEMNLLLFCYFYFYFFIFFHAKKPCVGRVLFLAVLLVRSSFHCMLTETRCGKEIDTVLVYGCATLKSIINDQRNRVGYG